MELTQLRYFAEVARCEHMTQAAETLNVSQPTLSHSIKSLEQELGVLLFTRSGRNIILTPYGRSFYQSVCHIFYELENAEREHVISICMGEHNAYGNYSGDGTYPIMYNKISKVLKVLDNVTQICAPGDPAPAYEDIKLCCSLYSFTEPFLAHEWDLETCIKKAHALGYEGVELVASQMVPNYPYPTDEWCQWFKDTLKANNLTMVCWSAYVDVGLRSDREQNEMEIYRYAVNDMINAKRVGAQVVRSQFGITPNVFRRMIPICKKLGIRLVIELHSPHNPDVPIWQALLDVIRSSDNSEGWLGVCPDFGIFQNQPHQIAIDNAYASGIDPQLIQDLIQKKYP